MSNPVLVLAERGGAVESFHRGALAIVDATGRPHRWPWATSPAGLPALGRQGAAGAAAGGQRRRRALGLTTPSWRWPAPRTAASRPRRHRRRMLAKAGLDATTRWSAAPTGRASTAPASALAAPGGQPSALHNNCSGKHSGFVCLGCLMAASAGPATRARFRARLREARSPGDARSHRRAAGRHRLRPGPGAGGHRRLLDPHLRHPAAAAGARLRAHGHRPPACQPATPARRRLRQAVAGALHGGRQRPLRHPP
jgi:hypothetical protein